MRRMLLKQRYMLRLLFLTGLTRWKLSEPRE